VKERFYCAAILQARTRQYELYYFDFSNIHEVTAATGTYRERLFDGPSRDSIFDDVWTPVAWVGPSSDLTELCPIYWDWFIEYRKATTYARAAPEGSGRWFWTAVINKAENKICIVEQAVRLLYELASSNAPSSSLQEVAQRWNRVCQEVQNGLPIENAIAWVGCPYRLLVENALLRDSGSRLRHCFTWSAEPGEGNRLCPDDCSHTGCRCHFTWPVGSGAVPTQVNRTGKLLCYCGRAVSECSSTRRDERREA